MDERCARDRFAWSLDTDKALLSAVALSHLAGSRRLWHGAVLTRKCSGVFGRVWFAFVQLREVVLSGRVDGGVIEPAGNE